MDYATFMDLMCSDDDKGMCEEFIRKQVTPKGYLRSILNQMYYMSLEYKYDNIPEENYIENLKGYLEVDSIFSIPNWYGTKDAIYEEVEIVFKRVHDNPDIVKEDRIELHDVLLLVKQSLESSDVKANDSTYFELIRLAIINGYKGNYKFINLLREE